MAIENDSMQIEPGMPQRVAIVVERNKSDTWSVAAYLVTAEGQRSRRSLGVFDTYADATKSLHAAWEKAAL